MLNRQVCRVRESLHLEFGPRGVAWAGLAVIYTEHVALSRTQIYTFRLPAESAFALGHNTLTAIFGNVRQIGPTALQSSSKISLSSWGEHVVLEVRPAPGGSAVAVTSSSALSTQFLDWGKHRKNIDRVFAAFAQSVGEAQRSV